MTDHERIVAALEDAVLASSIHNSQPWRFRIVGEPEGPTDAVDVLLDATTTPRAVDPVGRWALASIGAAVANLELALTSRTGRSTSTDLLPDGAEAAPGEQAGGQAFHGRVIARVRLGERATTSAATGAARLAGAIVERHVTRGPLLGGPPTQEEWAELRSAAAFAEGLSGDVAPDPLVRALLEVTARAEVGRQDEVPYLEELQGWLGAQAPAGTGIPQGAVGAPDAEGRVPVRDFTQTATGSASTSDGLFFEDPPALLVLHARADDAVDRVRAGLAMQRVMLEATALGLGVGVLGQALEQDELRAEVDALASEALGATVVVHQILRLGHPLGALDVVPTPRRPVSDLLLD